MFATTPGGYAADASHVTTLVPAQFAGPAIYQTQGTPTGSGSDDIRTVFVTGFPPNVHERELHNTVCNFPGYEASQMNLKPSGGGSPQGFVLFNSSATAAHAMQLLHDMQFDTECRLRAEMAHKNMFIKDDPSIRRATSRRGSPTTAAGAMLSALGAPMSAVTVGPPFTTAAGPQGYGGPLLASQLATLTLRPQGLATHIAAPAAPHVGLLQGQVPVQGGPVTGFGPVTNKFDNPPCNTLFIGNLGDNVDEAELLTLFATQPGYKQLKLLRQSRQVSCFVEFVDVTTAAAVHNSLQGVLIASSDRGPIRIQYSKNPYGKRSSPRDGSGGSGTLFSSGSNVMGANMVGEFAWPGTFTLG